MEKGKGHGNGGGSCRLGELGMFLIVSKQAKILHLVNNFSELIKTSDDDLELLILLFSNLNKNMIGEF